MSFIYRLSQMVVAGFLAATIPPLTHSPLLLSYIAHTIGRSAVILVYISRLNFSLLLPTIFSQAAFLVVFLISNTLYSAVYLGSCGFIAWGAIITKNSLHRLLHRLAGFKGGGRSICTPYLAYRATLATALSISSIRSVSPSAGACNIFVRSAFRRE